MGKEAQPANHSRNKFNKRIIKQHNKFRDL